MPVCLEVLLFLCPFVLMFSALAAARARYGVSPYVSWGHPDALVRGRQTRSGLVCFLCKLVFLCSRGKRLTHATTYVLLSTALADSYKLNLS